MTTKHTAGPWKTNEKRSGDFLLTITTADETENIGLVYRNPLQALAQANARLIAAAPDQHAALLAIIKLLDGSQPKDIPGAIMVAQAAIAKAKGAQ